MRNNINEIELPLQKVIDLGEIDRWLRGIAQIVPQQDMRKGRNGIPNAMHDFNRHIMSYAAHGLIGDADVERMVGFRQLISASSKNNVRVDITAPAAGALEVNFGPHEPFSRSRVFGASYANVLPALFGSLRR